MVNSPFLLQVGPLLLSPFLGHQHLPDRQLEPSLCYLTSLSFLFSQFLFKSDCSFKWASAMGKRCRDRRKDQRRHKRHEGLLGLAQGVQEWPLDGVMHATVDREGTAYVGWWTETACHARRAHCVTSDQLPREQNHCSEASASQPDVSLDKAGLDVASSRPCTYPILSIPPKTRGPCGHMALPGQQVTRGQGLSQQFLKAFNPWNFIFSHFKP